MFVVSFFFFKFFGDTLTSNNFPFGGHVRGNLSFIFDRPIICKTFKYIDESENIFWHVLILKW